MSIQRWDDNGPSPFGMYVLFSDHVAAVAEAYELGRTDGILLGEEKSHRDSVIVHEGAAENRGYRKGYDAGLDAARDAVIAYSEERIIKTGHPNMSEDITAALRVAAARIDALRGEQ